MATSQSATTNTSNSGGSTNTGGGLVGWRDANASIGGLDMSGMFSDSSKASATSGNITLGDTIMGGTSQKSFKFGIVKVFAVLAGVAIIVKIWKGGKK